MTRTLPNDRAAGLAEAAGRVIDGVRRRAVTIAGAHRRLGVAGVAVAIAGHLPRRLVSIQWYELHETITPGVAVVPPWPDTRVAGSADVAALAAAGQATPDDIRARLADGDVAYLAYDAGEPIGYLWFRARHWREDDTEFVLQDDERWAYDSFVLPAHRGRRIAPAVTVHAMDDLHRAGVRRVLSVIDRLNESSLRASRRYGARLVGTFVTVALPGLVLVHERPPDGGRGSWTLHRNRPIVRTPPPSAASPPGPAT